MIYFIRKQWPRILAVAAFLYVSFHLMHHAFDEYDALAFHIYISLMGYLLWCNTETNADLRKAKGMEIYWRERCLQKEEELEILHEVHGICDCDPYC